MFLMEFTFSHSISKEKFTQFINRCKRVFEAANIAYVDKMKSPSLPKKLSHMTFVELLSQHR